MTPINRHDLRRLARRRHWLVTYAELSAAGLTDDAVRHAVSAGHLHRIHRGVYAVGRDDLSREGWWLAAVLAAGDGALLSHLAAARLWGIVERGGERPHVLLPADSGCRSRRAFTVHRSSTLRPQDADRRLGIPVTSVPRTLIDCAAILERRALRGSVRQAERQHRIDIAALAARVAGHGTSPAHARLFAVLRDLVPLGGLGESELEQHFLELCVRHRIPAPLVQVPIAGYRADFYWPDVGLVVETDGRESHDTRSAFLDDRVKDRALKAAGLEVLRFTWAEVLRHGGGVAREVRGARKRLGRGGKSGSGPGLPARTCVS